MSYFGLEKSVRTLRCLSCIDDDAFGEWVLFLFFILVTIIEPRVGLTFMDEQRPEFVILSFSFFLLRGVLLMATP